MFLLTSFCVVFILHLGHVVVSMESSGACLVVFNRVDAIANVLPVVSELRTLNAVTSWSEKHPHSFL